MQRKLAYLKNYFKRADRCLHDNDQQIREYNWALVRVMTLLYLASQIIYLILVALPEGYETKINILLAAILAQAVYSIIVVLQGKAPSSSVIIDVYLMTFGAMIMALAICFGQFLGSASSSWLFLVTLILLTQIYTLPVLPEVIALVAYTVIYITLSWTTKDHAGAVADLVSGSTACVISLVSCFTLLHYKVESFEDRTELQRMCSVDALTGLLNKVTFEHFCNEYLRSVGMRESYTLAVMDIDRFKDVNDAYGHLAGDRALQWVAAALQSIGDGSVKTDAARFGGDEFMVLFHDDDPKKTEDAVQSFLEKIRMKSLDTLCFPLTVSVGLVHGSHADAGFADLFIKADKALYEAKNSGGSRFAAVESVPSEKVRPVLLAVGFGEQEEGMIQAAAPEYEIMKAQIESDAVFLLERYRLAVNVVIIRRHRQDQMSNLNRILRQISDIHHLRVIMVTDQEIPEVIWKGLVNLTLKAPADRKLLAAAIHGS